MVDLLLIAHAPLASAFRDVLLATWPDAGSGVVACDLPNGSGGDLQDELEMARRAADTLDPSHELLVLTDVVGATPANVACTLARERGAAVLSGLSVPMLLKAINYRHLPLAELAAQARTRAQECAQSLLAPLPTPPVPRSGSDETPDAAARCDHHQ